MATELGSALLEWSRAEEKARECQKQLRLHWEQRKTALERVKRASLEAGLHKGAVLQQNGSKIQLHEVKVMKPITVGAVERGLSRCVQDKEDVRAILAVIQAERGVASKLELRRLGN